MKLVNIPRTVNDDFYRYQMPELSLVFEAGARTLIDNLQQVAKALKCNPEHILKYFGYRIGTQITHKDHKYSLNGIYSAQILNKHLDKFISKYILCRLCSLPEINLSKTYTKIKKDCRACGNKEFFNPMDKFDCYLHNNLS
jgi:translation initiation factor 5